MNFRFQNGRTNFLSWVATAAYAKQRFEFSLHRVLQCVAVCCSVLQCVAVCGKYLLNLQVRHVCQSALQCVAVRCSVLHCVAVCCSLSQCVECVAVCCSVLQCPIRSQFILYTRWNIFFKVLVTHCMTLHDTAWHCSTLQHTATYCITLQHTAWHVQGLYSY